ncbi:hypothetical protein [Streptomyces sp. NPDC002685]|uniref:hypothetical protein n=1 Tax=Streptomyces sp. NPDC002685 TaxID=3154540 RepID=UPI003321C8F7
MVALIIAVVVVFVVIGLIVEFGTPLAADACPACRGRGGRSVFRTTQQWDIRTHRYMPTTSLTTDRCSSCSGSGKRRG